MPPVVSPVSHHLSRHLGGLVAMISLAMSALPGHGQPATPAAPQAHELVLTQVATRLRPATTLRLRAAMSGDFHLTAAAGPVQAGAIIGRFEDKELQTAVTTAQLQLQIARQAESDFIADQPARRQEARHAINELKNKLALAQAVAKDPGLLTSLPASVKESLKAADPTVIRSQLEAARTKLARLEVPDAATTSTAHLQVLDAEHALASAQERLAAAVLTAPFAGQFQPASGLGNPARPITLGAGQEIGTLRDVTRIEAAVPALSPYLLRAPLAATQLRLAGPSDKIYTASFAEARTESSPVTGEGQIFVYVFPAEEAAVLTHLINTNLQATVILHSDQPVTLVPKLQAALDHPNAFRGGWAAGVAKVWPGWKLIYEGETELGIAPTQP